MYHEVFITIIIPSFNAETYINHCLESLINQSFKDYEILVIDGLSTDNTLSIVKTFSTQNDRILSISEKDNGVYDAMNKGIEKASGEWLLFLGSDDQLYDNHVLSGMAAILKLSLSDFVYGNVQIIGDTSWAKDGDIYDGEFSREKLFGKNICHQGIFYRRSVFSKLGNYDTDYKTSADWDLNHRCFAFAKVQYQNEIVSRFFAGGNSTQNNNDKFTSEDIVLNLKKYHKVNYFNNLYKQYSWVFFNVSITFLVAGEYFKSLYFLFFSIWHTKNKIQVLKNYINNFLRRNKYNYARR
jgi:glycosyltransferase involved in cell wall biosynthesis